MKESFEQRYQRLRAAFLARLIRFERNKRAFFAMLAKRKVAR